MTITISFQIGLADYVGVDRKADDSSEDHSAFEPISGSPIEDSHSEESK